MTVDLYAKHPQELTAEFAQTTLQAIADVFDEGYEKGYRGNGWQKPSEFRSHVSHASAHFHVARSAMDLLHDIEEEDITHGLCRAAMANYIWRQGLLIPERGQA